MNDLLSMITEVLLDNPLIVAAATLGVITGTAGFLANKILHKKSYTSAIGIFLGLMLAYIGGAISGGSKGIADLSIFAGIGVLGGTSVRDFVIISTACGAKLSEIKKCGFLGIGALLLGVTLSYLNGAIVAVALGYRDTASIVTIAAGAVTFVVGPVTGATVGAESSVIAISIVAGLVKSVTVMILTPFAAKRVGLTTPRAAIVFGGLIGSVSGVSAGLTAVDTKLVPYDAMTASFYTGMGCILCPSVLYALTKLVLPF